MALDRLRHHRGTRLVMGNALAGRLLLSLRSQSVAIRTRAEVVELVERQGRIEGVDAGGRNRRHSPARPPRGGVGDRRLLAPPEAAPEPPARADARAFAAGRDGHRRRHRARPRGRRAARGGPRRRRLLGAGLGPAAARRQHRGVPALRARPRQARPDRRRLRRPALRQRGDHLPPLRPGDLRGPSRPSGDPVLLRLRHAGSSSATASAWSGRAVWAWRLPWPTAI